MTGYIVLAVCFLLGYWIVMRVMSWGDALKGGRDTAQPDGTDSDENEPVTKSNWFRILDVPENASREQISTAYRLKIAQYHPDKVAQLGPEIRALAEAKSKQINAAYDLGMRQQP
jgi:DnaJ-domain-containing protein 1